MRESGFLVLSSLAFVFAAGCSVPVRPGLDRDIHKLEEDFKEASELAQSDPRRAISDLKRVESAARDLAATFMIGDPRRDLVDKVLAEATDARKRIDKTFEEDPEARMERILAEQAQAAIEDGEESKEEVKGRPGGPEADMSIVDKALGVASRATSGGRVRRDADADFDRPGMARRRGGDKEGDIDFEKEFAKKEKRAPPKPRPRFTESVTVQRVEAKGKFAVVYLVFVSKGSSSRLASVTGNILDKEGSSVGNIMGAYLAKEFKPDWDDIYSSGGKWVTPESAIVAEADKPLFLAAVADSPDAKKAEAARVTVRTGDWRSFRGRGP